MILRGDSEYGKIIYVLVINFVFFFKSIGRVFMVDFFGFLKLFRGNKY